MNLLQAMSANAAVDIPPREIYEQFLGVDETHLERISRYARLWRQYQNDWAENDAENKVHINYVKVIINRIISFILGARGFELTIETEDVNDIFADQDPLTNASIEASIMRYWRKNNHWLLSYMMFLIGSVTGDVWVALNVKDKDLKIKVLDGSKVFPIFGEDPDVPEAMEVRQLVKSTEDENEYLTYVRKYTVTHYEDWVELEGERVSKITKIPHKFKELPIIHIPNTLTLGYYGESDIIDLYPVCKTYNEGMESINRIIKYHGDPMTAIFGARVDDVEKGANRIMSGLPTDGDVKLIGLDQDHVRPSIEFGQALERVMHIIGGTPKTALGDVPPISNTSGVTIRLLLGPLIDKGIFKQNVYGTGISRISKLIYKWLYNSSEYRNRMAQVEPDLVTISAVFPFNDLITAKGEILDIIEKELQLGLESRKNAMERLGKKNVPFLLREIESEGYDANLKGENL